MNYDIIGAIFLLCAFLYPFLLLLIDKIKGTSYSCKQFGWHNGNGRDNHDYDGASFHSTCSKCGKNVMQDSHGNWF